MAQSITNAQTSQKNKDRYLGTQNMNASKQQFFMGQPSHMQTLNQSALSNSNMVQLSSIDVNPLSALHQSPTLSPANANG